MSETPRPPSLPPGDPYLALLSGFLQSNARVLEKWGFHFFFSSLPHFPSSLLVFDFLAHFYGDFFAADPLESGA